MKKLTVIFILGLCQTLDTYTPFDFVVWNVGQGQWSTFVNATHCLHFDMGGEKFPKEVTSLCRSRKNLLYLSHEDWDHVSFIHRFKRSTRSFCLVKTKHFKKEFIQGLSPCIKTLGVVKELYNGQKNNDNNSSSSIYLVDGKILLPGDSPSKLERYWVWRLPKKLQFLVLAHHGSQTGTSRKLLEKTKFAMAIASARQSKYGHPHPRVQRLLKRKRVSLLKTETLGHLYIQL